MIIKAIAFDMDGTLGDTLSLCIESFRRCAHEYTGRRPSEQEVTAHFNVSDRGVLGALLSLPPDSPRLPLARMVQIYEELHEQYAPAPFPGVVEILQQLKARGLRLALLTGKESHTALPTLRRFGMQDIFEAHLYGTPTHNCKAEHLAELMQRWQLTPQELIYVGDAPSDIEQCRRVGIRIINAAWAPGSESIAAACTALHPDYRLTSLSQLLPLLLNLLTTSNI